MWAWLPTSRTKRFPACWKAPGAPVNPPDLPREAAERAYVNARGRLTSKNLDLLAARWAVSDDPGALALSACLQLGEEPVYLLANYLLALQEGVAHALDDGALLPQQILDLLARLGEYPVDLLARRPVPQEGTYRGAAGELVRDGAEGVEVLAHPEETDHRGGGPGRLPEVLAHSCRGLPNPDVFRRAGGQSGLDASHHVRACPDVAVLPLLVAHQPQGVLPLDDRDHLHLELLALEVPGGDRVPGLVGGDLDLLLLVVLDGLLEPDLVGQLRRPDVLPGKRVPALLQREDERLVDDVLDAGRGVPHRRLGELLEVYLLVAHLFQVVIRYVLAALLVRQPHVQPPVEAARPEESRVEGVGPVSRPDNQDVVVRYLPLQVLPDPQGDEAPEEAPQAPRLLEPVHLHQELVDEHAAHAPHPADEEPVHEPQDAAPPRLLGRSLEDPILQAVPERFVEGVGLHHLGDTAARPDGVELVHEDHGPPKALRELARLGEQPHNPQVRHPHEHVVEAGGRGVDERHVHLARYGFRQ